MGMDAVGVGLGITILLLIFAIYLIIESQKNANSHLEDYDNALEEMQRSLEVVAQVLTRLPEMVPQFQINENPLAQILQFFQQRAESQNQQTSLGAHSLRDDNGRYSNGEKEETS